MLVPSTSGDVKHTCNSIDHGSSHMRFETEHGKFAGRVVSPADSHIKEKEQNSIKSPCFSSLPASERSSEVGK